MKQQFPLTIRLGDRIMDFATPKVMGIINVTPDSFYAGSRVSPESRESLAGRAREMLIQGADILDIGAYSTRPGADAVSADEEYSRLAHALETLRSALPEDTVISVDTFRASVARRVVSEFGANIINDVGGGTLDPDMRDTVAELQVPYVLMHMRGTPQTMGNMCDYGDVTADVLRDLAFKADDFRQAGVADIIIDPGFGFAKTTEQNYRLLNDLDIFHNIGAPVLAGISRKTMLWEPLGITPAEALEATVAVHTIALLNGADIIRVHDVLPAAQSVKIVSMLRSNNTGAGYQIDTFTNSSSHDAVSGGGPD